MTTGLDAGVTAKSVGVDRTRLPFDLRPHQVVAVSAFWAAIHGKRRPTGEGVINRALGVMATGGGKTVVAGDIVSTMIRDGKRVLFIVHTDELVNQTVDSLHSMVPGASIGVVKAARDEHVGVDIVVASQQTLARPARRERLNNNFGLAIVDEADLALARTWVESIEWAESGGAIILGLTATPERSDGKPLVGPGGMFQEPVFNIPITEGIRDKWLCDLEDAVLVRVRNLDLAGVKRSRGDLSAGDLGDALERADAGNQIAEAYSTYGRDAFGQLRPGILFCPNKATASHFSEDLEAAGIRTGVITDDVAKVDRAVIFKKHRDGEIDVVINCMVLTRGYDATFIEVVMIARATKSRSLYRQMVGRGTRLCPRTGKASCLVIDFVGVTEDHTLASFDDLFGSTIKRQSGETARQAIERTDGELAAEITLKRHVEGEQVITRVSMYEEDDGNWLTSPKLDLKIIPAGSSTPGQPGKFFFLWPLKSDPTLVHVMEISDRGKMVVRGGVVVQTDAKVLEKRVEEHVGLSWARRYAIAQDPSIASRKSPWRSRSEVSAKQKEFLAKHRPDLVYGVDYKTRGEASNQMSLVIAGWVGL